ncbi:MAG: purine permease [Oscillospiraceae bacterium]|nr:purine permease [Oscillospiraceae bacterium]
MKFNTKSSPEAYQFEGKLPLKQALPLGLQHVLAMFVGNLTPLLIITGACGLVGSSFDGLQISLLQNAMIIAGIVTLIQLFGIGPIGGKVPIIMGTSSGFIGVFNSVASSMGGGIIAYGAIMGASLIGGIFETILGFFLKPLRKFFPSVVTGTVVLSIGLSLISVGVNSFGGGNNAKDFGSVENLLLALFVLVVILVMKHSKNAFLRNTSILIGIVAGYIVSGIMGLVLDTTAVDADMVEYTKSWVLNWDKVAAASWFAIPEIMPVKPVFDMRAIAPVLIMFIVTAVETVGDISGVTVGGMNREATDKELSGGVICDGAGSSLASLFGVLPNTSFSQNVGLVSMTKVVNRKALATGGIFLILCGLIPKLGAVISIMPQSVLGGAAVMMFSSIVISGIQLITREPLTARNLSIISVSLGLGYGMGANPAILSNAPQMLSLIFGGSGIVPAALVAILLNVLLPKDKQPVEKAIEMDEASEETKEEQTV